MKGGKILSLLFDLEKYHRLLNTRWLGQNISYFKELDSTNTYLKKLKKGKITHGHICLADHQIRGRGQHERHWQAVAGKNLTFTLAFIPERVERFHVLTLACACAAVEQIETSFGCEACIKWPNDVIIQDRKVAGFLTESVFNGNALDRLLIGVGLNVNQLKFPAELDGKAASLQQITGSHIPLEDFLCDYLARVEYQYIRWVERSDELLKCINKKIIGYGRWVHFQVDGQACSNKCKLLGINQKGQLTAVSREGDLKTFSHEQIRLVND